MRQMVDYMAPRPPNISTTGPDETRFPAMAPAPMVTWTSLETVLTNTALARLDLLGPRIRERVLDSISSPGEDDIKNVATALTIYELFLLKAQPHLEMPSLEETLTGDDLATFRSFSAADRDRAEFTFQWGLFHLHYAAAASHPTNSTIPKPTPDFLAEQAAFAMDWVKPSGKSEQDQDGTADPRTDRHLDHPQLMGQRKRLHPIHNRGSRRPIRRSSAGYPRMVYSSCKTP